MPARPPEPGPGGGSASDRVSGTPISAADLADGTGDPRSGALVVVCHPAEPSGDAGGSPPVDAARLGRALAALEEEATQRFGVRRCRLRVRPDAPSDEAAVVAAVRAPHRAEAFEAARWIVDAALDRLTGEAGSPAPGDP